MILEEVPHLWHVVLVNGADENVLDQWTSLSVTEDVDGVRVDIEVNGLEPAISYMRTMSTDLLLYRNNVLCYRVRIADSDDSFTRDAHIVTFSCVGYEKLLDRRILRDDVGAEGNFVLVGLDIDMAWWLINYTQLKETFGITRGVSDTARVGSARVGHARVGSTSLSDPVGVTRQRTLNWGDTILECVNDFAEAATGFDWWIDANKVWWAQKPRRGASHDVEWRWGAEIAEVVREFSMDDYASYVMATGAQNETSIPNPPAADTVYPPPAPQKVELATKPHGLWEVSVAYSDVITTASLLEKATWHLSDLANFRPTYKLTVETGIWSPSFGVGDTFAMRIEAAPRMDIRVPVRIEEISLGISPDGEEAVQLSVRAEEPETYITPLPGTAPAVAVTPPLGGRTIPQHRLRPWDDLAAVLRGVEARVGRQERSPSA